MMNIYRKHTCAIHRFCALLVLLASLSMGHGFLSESPTGYQTHRAEQQRSVSRETLAISLQQQSTQHSIRFLHTSILSKQNNDDDNMAENQSDDAASNPSNDTVITREMFQRELLEQPVVKRTKGKKKHKQYKVLDNRDSLPFRVEHMVPDPYTHPETKKKRANKNSVKKRRTGAIEESLTSRLYTGEDEDRTMIGEYMLDKHTTTGDLLEIGDRQYRVTRHKCQYKYAGGSKFVMVSKILQVKEVGRLMTEEYLKRQWKTSPDEAAS